MAQHSDIFTMED